jgi:histidinol phosphatase-like enzyme (inositol monophosphatase family)
MSAPLLSDYLAFAHDLADAARAAILPHFRVGTEAINKDAQGGFDPVTAGDRAGELAMRNLIAARYPDHLVYGEEQGGGLSATTPTWVLDPIDGTRAFISGLPTWGTLIGLDLGQGPVVGVMDQGFTGERFFAGDDGAYLDHRGTRKRLKCRPTTALAQATLATTMPELFTDAQEAAAFAAIKARVKLTRYGTDCYAYAMVAAGHIDLVIESGLSAYDIQALVPIITQAGGVVTSWAGDSPRAGGRIVAAATPDLHGRALEILSRVG